MNYFIIPSLKISCRNLAFLPARVISATQTFPYRLARDPLRKYGKFLCEYRKFFPSLLPDKGHYRARPTVARSTTEYFIQQFNRFKPPPVCGFGGFPRRAYNIMYRCTFTKEGCFSSKVDVILLSRSLYPRREF